MHGHVEHLLDLDSILSDGNMARRGETILLYHFAPSADRTECHETFIFKILNSFGELLFLFFTELLLGHLDGVVGVIPHGCHLRRLWLHQFSQHQPCICSRT